MGILSLFQRKQKSTQAISNTNASLEKVADSILNPKPCGRSYKIPSRRFSNEAIASYQTKIHPFLTPSLKITSGEISAKEAAEERIWAEQTPPAAALGPGRSEDQARQDETILHD